MCLQLWGGANRQSSRHTPCAVAVAGFCFAIFARIDQMAMHGMTTLPCLFAVAAMGVAWNLARSPRRVVLSAAGVMLDKGDSSATIAWHEIGYATVKQVGTMAQRKSLCICDCAGKTIASISDAFDDFDRMRDCIVAKIAERGDDTAERIRQRRAKRAALGAVALGIAMSVVSVGVAWSTHSDQRAAKLLVAEGVPGEAEIVRRFVAPNGVTTRLEYRIAGTDGRSATRNLEVERLFWEGLEGRSSVAVIYVPHEPEISRLTVGEPRETDVTKTPAGGYTLSALGALMGVFSFAASVMFWRGYDIKTDPATGKLAIKRFGAA